MDDIRVLQTQVASTYSQAADKRQQIQDHLETVIAANGESLKKLRSLTVKKTFSPIKTGMIPIKKKLEEDLGKAKEEVAEADKMWEDLNGTAKSKVYAE